MTVAIANGAHRWQQVGCYFVVASTSSSSPKPSGASRPEKRGLSWKASGIMVSAVIANNAPTTRIPQERRLLTGSVDPQALLHRIALIPDVDIEPGQTRRPFRRQLIDAV